MPNESELLVVRKKNTLLLKLCLCVSISPKLRLSPSLSQDPLKLTLSSSDSLKLTLYRCSSHFLRCRRQKMLYGTVFRMYGTVFRLYGTVFRLIGNLRKLELSSVSH
ncbi:hypothetical protein YC2023_025459 [Brassica napus]